MQRCAWRSNLRHPEKSDQLSAPVSILLLQRLGLYWLVYHIKDCCQGHWGWIYTVSQAVNAVWLQKRFEYPIMWTFCCEATKGDILHLKTSAQSTRKIWTTIQHMEENMVDAVLSLCVLEQVTINPCGYHRCLWWQNWISFGWPNLWTLGSYTWLTGEAPFRDQVTRRGTELGPPSSCMTSVQLHRHPSTQLLPGDTCPNSFWQGILTLYPPVTTSYVLPKQKHGDTSSGLHDDCPPQLLPSPFFTGVYPLYSQSHFPPCNSVIHL